MNVKLTKYFRSTPLHKLTRQEHNFLVACGCLNEFYPTACGIYEDDAGKSRIDQIGQNGNDGDHYDENPDGVGWPYEHGDDYIDKVNKVTQVCDHDFVYEGHGHNYDVYRCIHCGIRRKNETYYEKGS